jgi:hypothetical protein
VVGGLPGGVVAWDALALAACVAARREWRARFAVVAVTGVSLVLAFQRANEETGSGMAETGAVRQLRAAAPPPARVAGLNLALHPDVASLFGLSDARALDPVLPVRYRAFVSAIPSIDAQPTYVLFNDVVDPRIDLLGVAAVAADERDGRLPASWPTAWQGEGVRIAANPSVMPRAFVAPSAVAVGRAREAYAALRSIDLRNQIVVEDRDPPPPLESATPVTIVGYTPTHVTLDVDAPAEAYVVLTDTFDPGWRATVDGNPGRIVAADLLFRAVRVPAGAHRIEMRYEPTAVRAGGWISLIALLVCLGAVWWSYRRMGDPPPQLVVAPAPR